MSWICTLVILTSSYVIIRRLAYTTFRALHWFVVPTVLFGYMHMGTYVSGRCNASQLAKCMALQDRRHEEQRGWPLQASCFQQPPLLTLRLAAGLERLSARPHAVGCGPGSALGSAGALRCCDGAASACGAQWR